jgi:hypothetical protein
VVGEESIFIPSTATIRVDNTDSHLISLNDTQQESTGNFFDDHTRRLMQGYRKVLVVRVIDSSGVSTAASAQVLSQKMFGAGAPNFVSQFRDCSYGKLQFGPTESLNGNDPSLAAKGVYEVKIPKQAMNANRDTIREAVSKQLQEEWSDTDFPVKLSHHRPGHLSPFDHIIYCLPPGTAGGWIAYAYRNSWLTVFNDGWCEKLSAQVRFCIQTRTLL